MSTMNTTHLTQIRDEAARRFENAADELSVALSLNLSVEDIAVRLAVLGTIESTLDYVLTGNSGGAPLFDSILATLPDVKDD